MQYDLIAIFNSTIEPKAAEEKLKSIVEKEGFAGSNVEQWGKKLLVYPINKQHEGVYVSMTLSGSKQVAGLNSRFKVEETILRSLILKIDARKEKKVVAKGVV